jgi:hypothetical protein
LSSAFHKENIYIYIYIIKNKSRSVLADSEISQEENKMNNKKIMNLNSFILLAGYCSPDLRFSGGDY